MHPLKTQTAHLYLTHNEQIKDPRLLGRYHELLSKEEVLRYNRFQFAKHKHQFLVTRALLRSTLSRYRPSIAPKLWRFKTNEQGKPFIANTNEQNLHFNLSHCEKLIALIVSENEPVGVDIEWFGRKVQTQELAARYFSTCEVKALLALKPQDQRQRFFALWTLKEAYVKACGLGLSIPLNQFSFVFPKAKPVEIQFSHSRQNDPSHWHFSLVKLGEDHQLAAAINLTKKTKFTIKIHQTVPLT